MAGEPAVRRDDFLILSGRDATVPSPDDAGWICVQMQRWGQVAGGDPMVQKARESFRLDLYRDALQGAPA
jgi:hypothetical protein